MHHYRNSSLRRYNPCGRRYPRYFQRNPCTWDSRNNPLPAGMRSEIRHLHFQGKTPKEIADYLNNVRGGYFLRYPDQHRDVSESHVLYELRKSDIYPLKNPSRLFCKQCQQMLMPLERSDEACGLCRIKTSMKRRNPYRRNPDIEIIFRMNLKTGKKDIIIDYQSDEDAMRHEHERDHKKLVENLIGEGLIEAAEVGEVVIKREEAPPPPITGKQTEPPEKGAVATRKRRFKRRKR